jgi:hypothetical protein
MALRERPLHLEIDGGEPVDVFDDLDSLVERLDTALTEGTVLRLQTAVGFLLVNGRTVSSVAVAPVEQPTTAEPQTT